MSKTRAERAAEQAAKAEQAEQAGQAAQVEQAEDAAPAEETSVDEAPVEAAPGEELIEVPHVEDAAAPQAEEAPAADPAAQQAAELLVAGFDPEVDTREGPMPSLWEERFEGQINAFFDEAIARVPSFVDRHLRSFRRIMGRSLSPRTGLADVLVGVRNVAAGVSKTVGGPDFSTTSYTHDALTEAFEREVVSTQELESLLSRLFGEFEDSQWSRIAQGAATAPGELDAAHIESLRKLLSRRMEREIAHDPLLAQAIRSGLKIGIPATLGYMLFGKVTMPGALGSEAATELYKKNLKFYHKILMQLGRFEIPSWLGAVGWAGGVIGSLAVGGLVEYALNNVRDVKGAYIRQLNAARYILLYGDNPEETSGQGLLHIVRGLERQFERVSPETSPLLTHT
jgi:hypothetical protein